MKLLNTATITRQDNKGNKMSFTQEKEININRCDGCDKRCRLGWEEFTNYDCESNAKIKLSKFFSFKLGRPIHFVAPAIDGKRIELYRNQYGDLMTARYRADVFYRNNFAKKTKLTAQLLQKAREIAKLCDHYKTR